MEVDISTLKASQARMDADISTLKEGLSGVKEGQARMEADISTLKEGLSSVKEGQARLEGMFEGAFERIPRARPENGGEEGSAVTPPTRSST